MQELIIKKQILEIPSKNIKVEKTADNPCLFMPQKNAGFMGNNDIIFIDDILKAAGIKYKNQLTKTWLYWRLHNAGECMITYSIEYKINDIQYNTEVKFNFKMKPDTSSRVLDTMMSV